MPRVTVLLPTHNRPDVLRFALRSALWQTMRDFEVIVVADGCAPSTAEAVREFDDPRVHLLELPKAPGIGYANRNVALRLASGEWVAYLQHDDLWMHDHLERLLHAVKGRPADFVYSRGLYATEHGTIWPHWFNLDLASHRARLGQGRGVIPMSTVMHRTDALDRFGYWDETLESGGDQVQWAGIVLNSAAPPVFVSEPTTLRFTSIRRPPTRGYEAAIDFFGWRWLNQAVAPEGLRLPPGSGLIQARAAQWLVTDGAGVAAEIRRAVIHLQDTLLSAADARLTLALSHRCARAIGAAHRWYLQRIRRADAAAIRAIRRRIEARLRAVSAGSRSRP